MESKLRDKELVLPINTKQRFREKRIQEIWEHLRTQCLFGLEFDLTHLKVARANPSQETGYADNKFQCNETGT